MDIEIETLTDEEIEARLNGASSESEAPAETVEAEQSEQEQAAQTPGDTEATAPGSADQEAEQQAQPPAEQPRTVPLPEHIELRKRAQAAEEQLRQFQQQQAQQAAEAQQRAVEARYEELLLEDPEAAAQFAVQVQQQEQERIRAEFQQAQVVDRVKLSEEYARKAYGEDYDRQIAKAVERIGAETLLSLAAQQPNPAQWAYEFGAQFQTPEERQATIQAEVAKQLQEVLKKNQPPQSRGTTSIGTVSSATAEPHQLKDPEHMTDAELDAADKAARAKFR